MHNIKKIYVKIMAKGGELDRLTRELEAAYNPPEVDIILLEDVGGSSGNGRNGRRKLRLPDDLVVAKVRKGIPDH